MVHFLRMDIGALLLTKGMICYNFQLKSTGKEKQGENMEQSTQISAANAGNQMSTADAFYRVFCALPKKDRVAVARYIFQNTEIRQTLELTEIPNALTLKSFAEDKSQMPSFGTIKDLREDLLS